MMQPESLFVLVSVFSEFFLAFMGRNLPQFAFSSAGHFKLLRLIAIAIICSIIISRKVQSGQAGYCV